MKAHLITIGDEILIGQIIDSNSAYIAQKLNEIGLEVEEIFSIPDEKEFIIKTLDFSTKNADVVITTGGLGPTKDDVTKKALCEFLQCDLIYDSQVLEQLEKLFRETLKRPMNQLNRDQSLVPEKSISLKNPLGTAPGILTELNGCVLFNLPGVPFEMKNLIKTEIVPFIQGKFHLPFVVHKTISVSNFPESELAMAIEHWEDSLPSYMHLAYLPERGKVRLRISARGDSKENLEDSIGNEFRKLQPILENHLDSLTEGSVEVILGEKLKGLGLSISTAESCTGGNIAHLLTNVPGSSNYFYGSIVSYATSVKEKVLKVPNEIIQQYTVVSEEVAILMAQGVRKELDTDIGVSTTGVSGPSKGEDGKEIGTAWVAVANGEKSFAKMYYFPFLEREDFIHQISKLALQNVLFFLKEKN